MRYSELKERIILLQVSGYGKVRGSRVYKKTYSLGPYHRIESIYREELERDDFQRYLYHRHYDAMRSLYELRGKRWVH